MEEIVSKLRVSDMVRLNGLTDKDVRFDIITALEEIPFVYNLCKADRKRVHECPKDSKGRIIVNIAEPHVLENMDYFRQPAITFKKNGRYTDLIKNNHPRSLYMVHWKEEQRRCREGLVREDGEWITGYNYWYLNYCPIMLVNTVTKDFLVTTEDLYEVHTSFESATSFSDTVTADRIEDFPKVWDSDYLWFHYVDQAENKGQHCTNIKTRGRGYSFKGGSMLGRNYYHFKQSKSFAIASEGDYLIGDAILDKTWDVLSFVDSYTPWVKSRDFKNTTDHKKASYIDPKTKVEKGIKTEIIGVTTKNQPEKARGKRGKLLLFEEAGKFPHLIKAHTIARPSVEQGRYVFGTIVSWGTGGCVCAGTKVWTADGRLINVEDLNKGDGIIGFDGKQKSVENIPWMQEPTIKDCVRITTNTRRTIDCSTDHPIWKAYQPHKKAGNIKGHDFVEAKDIQFGDRIGIIDTVDIFGEQTIWEPRVLGWLVGDGSYGKDQTPCLSNCEKEINNYIESKFDIRPGRNYLTKTGKLFKESNIKGITKNLREAGIYGQTKLNKTLPTDINSCTKEDICEFIGGFWDADGYVKLRKNNKRDSYIAEISLSSMSESLLNEVRFLLQKLGIHGTMRKKMPNLNKTLGILDKNPWYEFTISSKKDLLRFAENITLFPKHKQEQLDKIKEVYQNATSHMDHEGIRYERVISVESIGKLPIYNLEAGVTHTYIANGIITHNTQGADFDGLRELFTNPAAHNIYGLPNVFDRKIYGMKNCGFYCGEYMNREGLTDENGNSDVIGALIEIFIGRRELIRSTNDPNVLVQERAERSITPDEAMMRKEGHLFNVEDLKHQLAEIETHPKKYADASWKVNLYSKEGSIYYRNSTQPVVRQYPIKENKGLTGCIEIFEHPIIDSPRRGLYIAGCDPYDDDTSQGPSLGCTFIMNRLTKRIVAEYTGRPNTAEEFYENTLRLLKYYNAVCNYENNKKGLFGYFDKMKSLYYLADTPKILRDMQVTKSVGRGNTLKGTTATAQVNKYGNSLLRSYLVEPAYGNDDERNWQQIPSEGMVKELIAFNPNDGNYDRVAALRMLMILLAEYDRYELDDDIENVEVKSNMDPFFLRTRQGFGNRFTSSGNDNYESKKLMRR